MHDAGTAGATVLRRVEALLCKAESTEFDAEREALVSKAQELMVTHAIDQARLDATRSRTQGAARQHPVSRQLRLAAGTAYISLRENLIMAVAWANRCQLVYHGWYLDRVLGRKVRDATIVGFPDDVAWVELLYTSLLVQLFGGAERAWFNADTTERRYGNRKTFTVSYGDGFIAAVNARLQAASQQAESQAEADQTGASLVLSDRNDEVKQLFDEQFPTLRSHKRGPRNRFSGDGWLAGQDDGQRATLNRDEQLDASRQSLPGMRGPRHGG